MHRKILNVIAAAKALFSNKVAFTGAGGQGLAIFGGRPAAHPQGPGETGQEKPGYGASSVIQGGRGLESLKAVRRSK